MLSKFLLVLGYVTSLALASSSAEAANCWVLYNKGCDPNAPPFDSTDCTDKNCVQHATGGGGPGEPPSFYYECETPYVSRKSPATHKNAKSAEPEESGKDAITTGTTFAYCDQLRSCEFGEVCEEPDYTCENEGEWSDYIDPTYDVVNTAAAADCVGEE